MASPIMDILRSTRKQPGKAQPMAQRAPVMTIQVSRSVQFMISLRGWCGAWGHGDPRFFFAKNAFELAHHFGVKDVLDHVGVAVDVTGRNVGVGDEVGFPEAVIAGHAGGFAKAGFAEKDGAVGAAFEMLESVLGAQSSFEFADGPSALGEDGFEGKGSVFDEVSAFTVMLIMVAFLFEDFVGGTEDVLAGHFLAKPFLAQRPRKDTACGGEKHAGKKEGGGNEHDKGACGKVGIEGADTGAEPATEGSENSRKDGHVLEVVGPESGGGGRA